MSEQLFFIQDFTQTDITSVINILVSILLILMPAIQIKLHTLGVLILILYS
jgi:hypothetical protein